MVKKNIDELIKKGVIIIAGKTRLHIPYKNPFSEYKEEKEEKEERTN